MKRTKYLAIAAMSIFSLYSCSDASDIVQDGIISQNNVWETLDDLELGLNGVYAAYNFEADIDFNATFTDNIKRGVDNNGQGQSLYNFVLIPGTSEASSIYSGRYYGINTANRVLNGIEELEFTEATDIAQENNIKAQVLTLRAMYHFDLFLYYTEDYSDLTSLAIPIVDYVPTIDAQPERNTVQEVLAFIKNDLQEASELISNSIGSNFYINSNTIAAVQAKVAMIEGDYDTVISLTDDLLADYPLSDQTEYEEMFTDLAEGESIFTLARNIDDSQVAALFYFNTVELAGNPYLEISNGLYNELSTNDVRYDVLVHPESQYVAQDSPDNILLINKYPGDEEPLVNDIKLIRSSEMLLLNAEAKARSNDLAGAAQYVKDLRDARFGSAQALPSYSTLEEALTDILAERRIEFAFEGKRYLDLKRIGADINRGVVRNATDCASFSAACGLPRSSYKFTLPIPQLELNANSNITQNTGY
ncbi:Starch-binding associating with outer membrane [Mesonia phycicola]|uniref:Starch-binding associating with outer membrane n=1 Tax=Mesonia phycicola TaxID=579105 RepID=A0A1M6AZ26_9FLAO|nr:RagB/SusD family nutrient uptake outer membrane protein [Mesonia phycicola]SHI41712.1 Starch-binding associating with outer membrane [Mesonia phycicola]